jgi:hypothetical protein
VEVEKPAIAVYRNIGSMVIPAASLGTWKRSKIYSERFRSHLIRKKNAIATAPTCNPEIAKICATPDLDLPPYNRSIS